MESQNQNVADVAVQPQPTCMESVNRIVKLPAVEQTIQTVHDIYEKVKVNIVNIILYNTHYVIKSKNTIST